MSRARIVLVRHGEPQSQLERRMAGHAHCLGLSDRGRAQVEALRDRLAATGELGDDVVLYSSLLRRAVESAAILAPALGGAAATAECRWCERHFADELDGVTGLGTQQNSVAGATPTVGIPLAQVQRRIDAESLDCELVRYNDVAHLAGAPALLDP